MKTIILLLMMFVSLTACKEKADINKLYNEAEDKIELEFKYANVDGIDYSGIDGRYVYHVDYDKIRGRFHIWTVRLTDMRINETFNLRLNKFHCTETQICFQNSNTRIIIENAGDYYIVHVFKLHRYGKFDSQWENWVTFHNSDKRVFPSTQKNSYGKNSDIETAISSNKEETPGAILNQRVFTVVYAISDDGFVNIRERPSSTAKVLGELHVGIDGLGEGVLLEKGDSWCKVSAGNIIGWAYTKYLGFQSWYKGTGDSILIANLPQTTIYENADVDEDNYKFTIVEKGTIISDSFKDMGKYYALFTNGTYLYVKKEDVKIVTKIK